MEPNDRHGGMAVEAAIVFPLFFLFVLVMFELGRYFMADAALGHAAQKSLALAKVIPQLEDDSLDESGNPKNAPLIAQIEDLARTAVREVYGNAGNLQVSLVLPQGVPTLRDVLNKEPMELLIRADFQPLFGTIRPVRLTHKAIGFREPLFASSMPELVNCFGEKVSQSQRWVDPEQCKCQDPMAQPPNCECPDWSSALGSWPDRLAKASLAKGPDGKCGCSHIQGAVVNRNMQYCECPPCVSEGESRVILNGSCQCVNCEEEGLVDDPSGACACPKCSSDPNSPAVFGNPGSCGCTCPFWPVSGTLPLGDYIKYENGGCVCTANQSTCDTLKPGSRFFFHPNYYGRMICDCRPCPGESVMNMTTHKCECSLDAANCESGNDNKVANLGTCQCLACTNGKKRINGACRCPPDVVQDCVSKGGRIYEDNCSCVPCNEPSVPSADGSKCDCPAEASCEAPKVLERNGCYCRCPEETTPCPPGRYYDDSETCSCRCQTDHETNFTGDCKGCVGCPGKICSLPECETHSCSMGANCQLVVNET